MPFLVVNEDPALYAKLASNVGYERGQQQLRQQSQRQFEVAQQQRQHDDSLAQQDESIAAANARATQQQESQAAISDAGNANRLELEDRRGANSFNQAVLEGGQKTTQAILNNQGRENTAGINAEARKYVTDAQGNQRLLIEDMRGGYRLAGIDAQQDGANGRNDATLGVRQSEGALNRTSRENIAGMRGGQNVKTPEQLDALDLRNAKIAQDLGDMATADYYMQRIHDRRTVAPVPSAASEAPGPEVGPGGAYPPHPPMAPLGSNPAPAAYKDGDTRLINGKQYVRQGGVWVPQ